MNLIYDIILISCLIWQPNQAVLRGKCNECNAGAACVSENQFAICINGQLDANTITLCPTDYVCTGATAICESTLNGNSPICYEDNCNTCVATQGLFACVDDITYGFCYGQMEPDINSFTECPTGLVCNLADPEICSSRISTVPSCLGSTTPTTTPTTTTPTTTTPTTTSPTTTTPTTTTPTTTTPTTTTPTTTTPTTTTPTTTTPTTTTPTTSTPTTTTPTTTKSTTTTPTTTTPTTTTPTTTTPTSTTPFPSDPDTFCANKKAEGFFKDESDPKCKNYFHCYPLAGEYLGTKYICYDYFNDAISKCDVEKPIGCV